MLTKKKYEDLQVRRSFLGIHEERSCRPEDVQGFLESSRHGLSNEDFSQVVPKLTMEEIFHVARSVSELGISDRRAPDSVFCSREFPGNSTLIWHAVQKFMLEKRRRRDFRLRKACFRHVEILVRLVLSFQQPEYDEFALRMLLAWRTYIFGLRSRKLSTLAVCMLQRLLQHRDTHHDIDSPCVSPMRKELQLVDSFFSSAFCSHREASELFSESRLLAKRNELRSFLRRASDILLRKEIPALVNASGHGESRKAAECIAVLQFVYLSFSGIVPEKYANDIQKILFFLVRCDERRLLAFEEHESLMMSEIPKSYMVISLFYQTLVHLEYSGDGVLRFSSDGAFFAANLEQIVRKWLSGFLQQISFQLDPELRISPRHGIPSQPWQNVLSIEELVKIAEITAFLNLELPRYGMWLDLYVCVSESPQSHREMLTLLWAELVNDPAAAKRCKRWLTFSQKIMMKLGQDHSCDTDNIDMQGKYSMMRHQLREALGYPMIYNLERELLYAKECKPEEEGTCDRAKERILARSLRKKLLTSGVNVWFGRDGVLNPSDVDAHMIHQDGDGSQRHHVHRPWIRLDQQCFDRKAVFINGFEKLKAYATKRPTIIVSSAAIMSPVQRKGLETDIRESFKEGFA